MKVTFIIFLLCLSGVIYAREIGEFNHVLIQNLQRDIANENDENLKVKNNVGRGPASVGTSDEEGTQIKEDQKIDKMNVRQISTGRW